MKILWANIVVKKGHYFPNQSFNLVNMREAKKHNNIDHVEE